jgi:regulator of cell morphogenesis and NO signaling
MEINNRTRVGDIVKENFRAARIFDENNIDFCCGGNIRLEEACARANIKVSDILSDLETITHSTDPESQYLNNLALNELCDYIEKRHHSYVNENLPFLLQKLTKLCDVHGVQHPELFEVKGLFEEAAGNLGAHMKKEELVLFPYIRKMVAFKKNGHNGSEKFGNVIDPITVMEKEHAIEGERFRTIAQLTSNYTCPPDGCNTYFMTYEALGDFEKDLHRHIHLENNILFRKALVLEDELLTR